MEKHPSVLELLAALKEALPFEEISISNNWDGDLCALGLVRDNRLVYINTFKYLDEQPPRYDLDLEILNSKDSTTFETVLKQREISQQEVIAQVREHLKV